MVICKYYLQGRCKFGPNCRFEHQNPNSNSQQGGVLRPSQFSGFGGSQSQFGGGLTNNQSNPQQHHLYSVSEVLPLIKQEMMIWEKSKMWPFSCFGYAQNIPSLPGMEDLSMDEVRLKAYEAIKTGSLSEYKQWVSSVAAEYNKYCKLLQNMDGTTKSHLVQFVNDVNNNLKTSHQSSDTKSSIFSPGSGRSPLLNSEQHKSAFNTTGNPNSVFGTSNQSLFGNAAQKPSAFGQSGTASLFGNPENTGQSLVFGSSSVFGNSGSAFGNQNAAQSSGSVFGNASTAPTFGSSILGNTGTTQSFGSIGFGATGSTQPSETSGFGSTASAQSSGTSVFGSSGSAQSSGTPSFGGTINTQASGTSIFGSATNMPASGSSEISLAARNQFASQTGFGSQLSQSDQSTFGSTTQSGQTNQPAPITGTNQSDQSAFSVSTQPSQNIQSAFGNSNQPGQSVFGNVIQTPSSILNQQHNSVTPSQAPQTTASALSTFSFAPSTQNKENVQTTETTQVIGLFGKPASQTGPAPGSSDKVPSNFVYTPLDQLTPLEKQQFEAKEFSLDSVPIRAPPKELC